MPNTSGGYHGILIQWLRHYSQGRRLLMIAEASAAKRAFAKELPEWTTSTLDLYEIQDGDADYRVDLCGDVGSIRERFDVVLSKQRSSTSTTHIGQSRTCFRYSRTKVSCLCTLTRPRSHITRARGTTSALPRTGSTTPGQSLSQHFPVELLHLFATRGHVFVASRKKQA